jgi:hypothetical protein
LDFPIWEYDPAIEGKDLPPRPADLVVCVDVLEHVEPQYLDATLRDIARCTTKIGYFIISTTAAVKILPNGQNTHLIQKNKDWWGLRLSEHFHIPKKGLIEKDKTLYVIVSPKNKKPEYKAVTLEKREDKCPSGNALMASR